MARRAIFHFELMMLANNLYAVHFPIDSIDDLATLTCMLHIL